MIAKTIGFCSVRRIKNQMSRQRIYLFALFMTLGGTLLAQEKSSALDLLRSAPAGDAELAHKISQTFTIAELKEGRAFKGNLSSFLFAIDSASKPALMIDGAPGPQLLALPNTSLWYAVAEIPKQGVVHSFFYVKDGKRFGGSTDLPVFGPLAYITAGTPSGTLSPPIQHTSKIYDGMQTTYWVYVPAQYDPKVPAALMVIQDGQYYIDRDSNLPFLNVLDNLMAQKKIPVTICVFVSPGKIGSAPGTRTHNAAKAYSEKWHRDLEDSMRSILYDTVSDRYPRFLRDELLPEVEAKYNIRKDSYSRAIMGLSSGAICSFNAAWQMPDQFGRVISWIGSYVSLQWKEDPELSEGGQDYPDKVLRGPKRNLRVWLQDGSRDMESGPAQQKYGSWIASNLRMANALKLAGYDFHFSFGEGSHSGAQGAVELPEELVWLWRDYDPAKTEQIYEQDKEERAKPPFRFTLVDRATDN